MLMFLITDYFANLHFHNQKRVYIGWASVIKAYVSCFVANNWCEAFIKIRVSDT